MPIVHRIDLGLPDWAKYFVRLGSEVGALSASHKNLHIAVVVPRRDFLANLTSLGAVSAWANRCDDMSDENAQAWVISLERGTRVTVMEAGKRFEATFIELVERSGALFAKLLRERDGITHYVPQSLWGHISEGGGGRKEAYKRPPAPSTVERRVTDEVAWVTRVFGLRSQRFFERDRTAATIVGSPATLQVEQSLRLTGEQFESPASGSLGALLRTQGFDVAGIDGHFASTVFSHRSRINSEPAGLQRPDCAIFDGANGYLHFRQIFPGTSSIAIFDRRSSAMEEATELFNSQVAVSEVAGGEDWKPSMPPPGCEIAVFYERQPS